LSRANFQRRNLSEEGDVQKEFSGEELSMGNFPGEIFHGEGGGFPDIILIQS